MYFLIIPAFIFYEGRYLINHPWTFNLMATIVWATITGMSFLLFRIEKVAGFTPFVWGAATLVYYLLKINLNRRRPRVMQLHREHYRSGPHSHKKKSAYWTYASPKKGQDKRRSWPTKKRKERN